jgi:hypothetical protein
MKWAALTIAPALVLAAVLCYFAGPLGDRVLHWVGETTPIPVPNGPAVLMPDLGLVRLLRSIRPHARGTGGSTHIRIWVNTRSGVYYCPDAKLYGRIKPGLYMVETTALQHGYRPALGRTCP